MDYRERRKTKLTCTCCWRTPAAACRPSRSRVPRPHRTAVGARWPIADWGRKRACCCCGWPGGWGWPSPGGWRACGSAAGAPSGWRWRCGAASTRRPTRATPPPRWTRSTRTRCRHRSAACTCSAAFQGRAAGVGVTFDCGRSHAAAAAAGHAFCSAIKSADALVFHRCELWGANRGSPLSGLKQRMGENCVGDFWGPCEPPVSCFQRQMLRSGILFGARLSLWLIAFIRGVKETVVMICRSLQRSEIGNAWFDSVDVNSLQGYE